jgi:hypothetical protein
MLLEFSYQRCLYAYTYAYVVVHFISFAYFLAWVFAYRKLIKPNDVGVIFSFSLVGLAIDKLTSLSTVFVRSEITVAGMHVMTRSEAGYVSF